MWQINIEYYFLYFLFYFPDQDDHDFWTREGIRQALLVSIPSGSEDERFGLSDDSDNDEDFVPSELEEEYAQEDSDNEFPQDPR